MNKQNIQLNIPVNPAKLGNAAGFLAVLLGMIALVAAVWLILSLLPFGGSGVPLIHLLDEFDDELEAIALLAAASVVCGLASRFLRRRAKAPADAEPEKD